MAKKFLIDKINYASSPWSLNKDNIKIKECNYVIPSLKKVFFWEGE